MTPANAYLSGHIKCGGCGQQSPTSTNTLEPFRWWGGHVICINGYTPADLLAKYQGAV